MLIDMHVHTKRSADSALDPKKIAKIELGIGVECVAITDHDAFSSFAAFRNTGIKIIRGQEISTDKGHLIGLFLEESVVSRNFYEACDEIRSQAGICVLPHPFRSHKDVEFIVREVDVIEVFNARTSPRANLKALELARKENIGFVCGSDAHFEFELGRGIAKTDASGLDEAKKRMLGGNIKLLASPSPLLAHPMTWFVKGIKAALAKRSFPNN